MFVLLLVSVLEHSFDLRDKVKKLIRSSLEAQDRNGETSTPSNADIAFNTPVRGGSSNPPNAVKSSAAVPEAERGAEGGSGRGDSNRKPRRKNRGGKKQVSMSQGLPTAAKTPSASIDYSAQGVSTSGGGSSSLGGGSSGLGGGSGVLGGGSSGLGGGSTKGQRGGRRRTRRSRRKGPVTGVTNCASPRSSMSVTPFSQSQKPLVNGQKQQQQKQLGKGGTSKAQGELGRQSSLTNSDETNLNKGFVSHEVVKALLEPSEELVRWDDRARDFLIRLLQVRHGDGGRRGGVLVVCALCPSVRTNVCGPLK